MTAQTTATPASAKRAYSIPEACELVSVSRSFLYVELKEGRLRAHKLGRRTVIRAEELEAWLNRAPVAGADA